VEAQWIPFHINISDNEWGGRVPKLAYITNIGVRKLGSIHMMTKRGFGTKIKIGKVVCNPIYPR
jgi:hypothetical protein